MPGSKELFQKYINPVFIETGSFHGDGINQAVEAGYKWIYSIELSPELYNLCRARFVTNEKVKLLNGDSGLLLPSLLKMINERITFWLDGHYCGPGTAHGVLNSPLLNELEAIMYHRKDNTILIDDLRGWELEKSGFDTDTLIEKLLEINPRYKISFEDSYDKELDLIYKNDILVASC